MRNTGVTAGVASLVVGGGLTIALLVRGWSPLLATLVLSLYVGLFVSHVLSSGQRIAVWGLGLLGVLIFLVGPWYVASSASVLPQLPVYVGIASYQLPMIQRRDPAGTQARSEVSVALGAGARRGLTDYRVTLPIFPEADDRAPGANSPTTLRVSCTGAPSGPRQCTASVEIDAARRDYHVEVTGGTPRRLGVVEIPSEAQLYFGFRSPGNAANLEERSIPIEVHPDHVTFGRCAVPRAKDPLLVSVLDLAFMETSTACRTLVPSNQDRNLGRWIRREPNGAFEIPTCSYFQIDADGVRYVPLESRSIADRIELPAEQSGAPPLRTEFVLGAREPAQVIFVQRTFQDRSDTVSAPPRGRLQTFLREHGLRDDCRVRWHATSDGVFGQNSACLQVRVSVTRHAVSLSLDPNGSAIRVELGPSLRSDAFVEIPNREWARALAGRQQPVQYIYHHGHWIGSASPYGTARNQEVLDVPFRLLDGPPFRATLDFRRADEEVAVRLRDGVRQQTFTAPAVVELGAPSGPSARLEVADAPAPGPFLRGAMWPALTLLALFVLFLGQHPRVALLGAGVAVILLWTTLVRAILAYSVILHRPYDWKAFDQLVVGSTVTPLAVALVSLAVLYGGPLLERVRRSRRQPAMAGPPTADPDAQEQPASTSKAPGDQHSLRRVRVVVWVALVAVGLARVLFSLFGREQLGGIRIAVAIPLIAAGLWWLLWTPDPTAHAAPRTRWWSPFVAGFVAVAPWYNDGGAMLIIAAPALLAVAYASRHHRGLLVAASIAAAVLVFFPRQVALYTYLRVRQTGVTTLPGGPEAVCTQPATTTPDCQSRVYGDVMTALDTMHLLDATRTISERRHPLRVLDWVEDGGRRRCMAMDRLPTRDGLEVGFFRAVVQRYHQTGADGARPLRDDLLPFSSAVSNALLNDYLGAVLVVPQLPRGSLGGVPLMLAILTAAAWVARKPTRSARPPWWFPAIGALAVLTAASILTTAANLDVLPNFAQSLPLLAIRSGSALFFDTLALMLFMGFWCLDAVRPREESEGHGE